MNTTGTLLRATWKDLHRTAIAEQDDPKGRITEAYDAIMSRMLRYSMVLSMEQTLANAEYRQLTDALNDLRELRQPQGRSSVSLKLTSLPT
jgi:hypothetical protein